MAELKRLRTKTTRQGMARALAQGYRARTGRKLSRNLGELMWAQLMLESGNGQKLFNHNPGNIIGTHEGNYRRPFWWRLEKVEEMSEGPSKVRMLELHRKSHLTPPQAPTKFRAYPTLADGLSDYVRLLHKPRYRNLLARGESGDAAAWAREVKASHYDLDLELPEGERTFESLQKTARNLGLFKDERSVSDENLPSAGGGALLTLFFWRRATAC